MRLAALSYLALAALAACAPSGQRAVYSGSPPTASRSGYAGPAMPVGEATASGAELAFATDVLASLQLRSFAGNREYCGYLGLDAEGRLVATPAVAGGEASCSLPRVPAGISVLASFHTHSTYSPYYASEWPTAQDIATDRVSGIDGYISTPGGRLWHVDTDTMTVRLLCGAGCLPQDPRYDSAQDGPLRPVMTYRDLVLWERSISGPF